MPNTDQLVVVLDFGAQYGQLIARRVRDLHVYSEIMPCDVPAEEIAAKHPSAIILSGGPASVYAEDAPDINPKVFELGVPVLGFCYGQQIMAVKLGGSVGYQSYSQDKSAYFPTNSEWQQTLETAVSNGFAKEAYYSATSKSGIGYTLRAGADYKVNKQMTLGGQIGYDTFGDYNESTAGLYIRYMLGDH